MASRPRRDDESYDAYRESLRKEQKWQRVRAQHGSERAEEALKLQEIRREQKRQQLKHAQLYGRNNNAELNQVSSDAGGDSIGGSDCENSVEEPGTSGELQSDGDDVRHTEGETPRITVGLERVQEAGEAGSVGEGTDAIEERVREARE